MRCRQDEPAHTQTHTHTHTHTLGLELGLGLGFVFVFELGLELRLGFALALVLVPVSRLGLGTDLGRNDAELSASGARVLHLPPCRHQHLHREEWVRIRRLWLALGLALGLTN